MKRLGLGLLLLAALLSRASAGPIDDWGDPNQMTEVRQGSAWTIAHIGSVVHVVSVSGSGSSVSQSGQWNVAHISGILHVRVSPSSNANDLLGTHAQVRDKNCTTCSVRVDHVGAMAVQAHQSGSMRAWQVNACGGTATMAVASNASRRDLILKNLGGAAANSDSNVIFVGFGTTGHVALTTANGFPITVHMSTAPVMATPPVVLSNYQGPLACITNANTAVLSVIEVLQ